MGTMYRSLRRSLLGLPNSVWALGLVSLFMDMSSELVHSLLPVLMGTVLGASMVTIGLIEGIAEGVGAITKVLSGACSDFMRRRKLLLVIGYGLAALSKPLFSLASAIGWVFAGRCVDRIGKGIRGAPRDALIADITPTASRGAAYGLRQALDSVGAFLGPLLALVFMALLANDITAVLWIAVVPALLAVALLTAVREPQTLQSVGASGPRLNMAAPWRLPRDLWLVVLLGSVFSLARFSEAFLVLRAVDVGLTVGLVPLIMIAMNVAYALTAYPAGQAADRGHQRALLLAGLAILIAADLVLANARTVLAVFAGAALWGVHMGLTQGLLAQLVAAHAPDAQRGTAFGVFNLCTGAMLIVASVMAGLLWDNFGAAATFVVAGGCAVVVAIMVLVYRPVWQTSGFARRE